MNVSELNDGSRDSAGSSVVFIYHRHPPYYAVYRTDRRMKIHFADDGVSSVDGQPLASEQRLALSELAPLRSQIDGLLDGWRSEGFSWVLAKRQSKAQQFDVRLADALELALKGFKSSATQMLNDIRTDILEERLASARANYLLVAASVTVGVMALMLLLSGHWYNYAVFTFSPMVRTLWLGACMGALGAMFSIALGIRDRKVAADPVLGVDLQSTDNFADASLRIVIGAVSALILFAFLMNDFVTITVGKTILQPMPQCIFGSDNCLCPATKCATSFLGLPLVIVLGFVAGFSERMVSNLLERTVISQISDAHPSASARSGTQMQSGSGSVNDPMGRSAHVSSVAGGAVASASVSTTDGPDDDPDTHMDCCLADRPASVDEMATEDIELPEATGGVADVLPAGNRPE